MSRTSTASGSPRSKSGKRRPCAVAVSKLQAAKLQQMGLRAQGGECFAEGTRVPVVCVGHEGYRPGGRGRTLHN